MDHARAHDPSNQRWQWPLPLAAYDRTPLLLPNEWDALVALRQAVALNQQNQLWHHKQRLGRLLTPLDDALRMTGVTAANRSSIAVWLLGQMQARQTSLWAWSNREWRVLVDELAPDYYRHPVLGVAYLLGGFRDVNALQKRTHFCELAYQVFGRSVVDASIGRVYDQLATWGYRDLETPRKCLCRIFLVNGSPYLEDLTPEFVTALRAAQMPRHHRRVVGAISHALVRLGIWTTPLSFQQDRIQRMSKAVALEGIAPEWLAWCQRWYDTSTLDTATRRHYYATLIRVGRWLAQEHPTVTHPQQWTRELAAAFVAAVLRLRVGDWSVARRPMPQRGKPVMARTKDEYLCVMRTFFHNCQEWEWIKLRFTPHRALATPISVKGAIGPAPRDIAHDLWAKLLAAGLNLTEEDIAIGHGRVAAYYPLALVRAVVIVWLFAGLRSNEIRRLRVGCVRWQDQDLTTAPTGTRMPQDTVCYLAVPVNKTSAAYTKPVDRYVGLAIEAWEQQRPTQPPALDAKTGELVPFLFSYRNRKISQVYLNNTIIPLLCAKAGVPERDAKGNITSHRARSTIATQLYNADEPMTLDELREWLGHTSLETTRHYARVLPTKLTKAFTDAGYFARNMRTIAVLIDQQAVLNGAAATGLPWKYYDLGHGYCSYDFFEQCEHRMACAQCDYYRPKNAFLVLLEEKKQHLLYMKQDVPLTELELATVDGDLAATEQLIAQLRDTPTPAGPTPRELDGVKE